jgi:hypothetical protein
MRSRIGAKSLISREAPSAAAPDWMTLSAMSLAPLAEPAANTPRRLVRPGLSSWLLQNP